MSNEMSTEMGIEKTQCGKVWLVGAGPSDPGLFTLKGKAVLEQAQVVVYDALVGAGVLAMIPKTAEKIYVGKRAGNHAMPQEKINELLLKKAKEGRRVVRLKGGDPFLFGRGGEELLLLRAHGIAYEVVPGISSALAVPAYGGIPVTHREFASSVHIITGHKKKNEALDLPFDAYVKLKGTLVFLMGVLALPDIMQGLLSSGMSGSVPAAVLEKGTTAGQRRVLATVATLEEAVQVAKIQPPAIIVVGEVAALGEQFAWYESLPLFGRRYVLTRPADRISVLAERLREKGAEVIEQPAIETAALPFDETQRQAFDDVCQNKYDCLVFTSPAGVRIFFEKLGELHRDIRALGGVKLAVIGSGTKKELEAHGLFADFIPEVYNGEMLGRLLGEALADKSRVLIARSNIGNPELIRSMELSAQAAGKTLAVTDLPIYETRYVKNELFPLEELLAADEVSGVFFTSASTVRGFLRANPGLDVTKVRALCIGEMTAQAAREAGMQVEISKEASIDSLIELAEKTART